MFFYWFRYVKTQSEFVNQLPSGKHSTKGIGRTTPNPEGSFVMDNGAVIPMGKGMSSSTTYTSLLYNEYPCDSKKHFCCIIILLPSLTYCSTRYIVYDVAQINMKYLLKMNFKYRW